MTTKVGVVMGISVRELLNSDFFKEYKIIGGENGLEKQIQGVAILDAADGFQWCKGREFVISSGYIFKHNPGVFEEYVKSEYFTKTTCFGIKVDRYLGSIPDNIIEYFNKHEIPLIHIPSKDSWMEIMNAINVTVMNKNIKRFNIEEINSHKFLDISYQARKINKILSALEYEMNFSSMLYDLSNDKAYYSSNKFKEVSKDLKISDFWNPSFEHSQEVLCESIKMSRYRFHDSKYEKPFSWITIPIKIDNKVKAYFVLIEATELIDYFDQFAIRVGFLLIQELYEQMLVKKTMEDSSFDKFIDNILSSKLDNKEEIIKSSEEVNLNANDKFYTIVMKQKNENIKLSSFKDALKSFTISSFAFREYRMSIIDDNKCLFLLNKDENYSEKENINFIKDIIYNTRKRLISGVENIDVRFGISDIPDYIYNLKENYKRAEQAVDIGTLIYQNEDVHTYSQLGAFAWMNIKDDEINIMLKDIKVLIDDEKNKELIQTLKIYLECKMNFSLTAKTLYVHINTVRKRIEEITDLLNLDLEDSMNRLKLEILLRLFY